MRFPDRPALNVILGVVCALVVLVVLASPLTGAQSSPVFINKITPSAVNSGGASSTPSSSDTGAPPMSSFASSASSPPSFVTSSTSVAESLPSPNSSQSSVSGSKNSQIPTNSSVDSLAPASSSATTILASTATALSNAHSNTTVVSMVTTVFPAQTTTIQNISSVASSAVSPSPVYSTVASGNTINSQTYRIFGILSISSVIVAVGSTLFVYRRVSREDNSEE